MRLDNLASRVQKFRRLFQELSAAETSNRQIIQWNHDVELEVANVTGLLRDTRSFSLVANQKIYTLPDEVLDVEACLYLPNLSHYLLPSIDRDAFVQYLYQTGLPQCYTSFRGKSQLGFWPVPSTAAQSTALNGALSATATTITVDATTSFGNQGRITIDDEVISYTGLTSTTFTGCVRGAENTIAASHSDDATVTWRDVEVTCVVKPQPMAVMYSSPGTITTTNGSKTVTGSSTTFSADKIIKAGQWFGVGSLETAPTDATFPLQWYKIASVDSDTQLTLDLSVQEKAVSANAYLIADPSSYEESVGDLILTGMLARALFMVRSPMYAVKQAEYKALMSDAKATVDLNDYVAISRPRGTAVRYGIQPSTAEGGYYPYYGRS